MSEEWKVKPIGYATMYESHLFIEPIICGMWLPTDKESEEYKKRIAYAKLIAAAPELLAILQEYVRVEIHTENEDGLTAKAKAAIAKATE